MYMAEKPFIPVVLGTARVGRNSESIAKYIFEIFKNRADLETILVDVKDYIQNRTIPPWEKGEVTKPWRDIVQRASAFVIVTPEYNHGYPGELKMLLDQDGKAGYGGKPVVFCGVSEGQFGGARVVEHIAPIARELGLIHLPSALYFPNVEELMQLSREDLNKQYQEKIDQALRALLDYLA